MASPRPPETGRTSKTMFRHVAAVAGAFVLLLVGAIGVSAWSEAEHRNEAWALCSIVYADDWSYSDCREWVNDGFKAGYTVDELEEWLESGAMLDAKDT